MKQSVYYDRFPYNTPIPVNSVADLGEGLGDYSPPPSNLKEYKKRYKKALMHIPALSVIFTLYKIWQPLSSGVEPTTPPASPTMHFIRPFLKVHQMCALNLNFDNL